MRCRVRALALSALLVLCAAIVRADGDYGDKDVDKDRLCALVRMPGQTINFAFKYDNNQGYIYVTGADRAEETPESVRKTLRGDDTDAERYLRLGNLYSDSGDQAEANKAWQQSLALYLKQLKGAPDSGNLLADLARVYNALGRHEERDATLARALKAAPRNPRVWSTRGDMATADVNAILIGSDKNTLAPSEDHNPSLTLFRALLGKKLSDEQIRQALHLLNQASDDYNKAIAVAPENADLYSERAAFRTLYQPENAILQDALNHKAITQDVLNADMQSFAIAAMQPANVQDYLQTARLSHNQPYALGMAMTALILSDVSTRHIEFDPAKGNGLALLSPQAQADAKDLFARLETLSHAPDPKLAAHSAMTLGLLQVLAVSSEAGEATLRRANALLPYDPDIVETFVILYVNSKRWADLAAYLTQVVQHHGSVRWRLMLAHIQGKLEKWQEAEQNVRAALKTEPANPDANLALTALLLRTAKDANRLKAAEDQMSATEHVFPQSPSRDQTFSFGYLHGILLALEGKKAEARQGLEALHGDSDDEADVKNVLALLTDT